MPTVEVVVAGHVSLDVFPALRGSVTLEPGRLVEVGPAAFSTGGAVANTGLALHRLGVPVRLVGRVGADLFGRAVLEHARALPRRPGGRDGRRATGGDELHDRDQPARRRPQLPALPRGQPVVLRRRRPVSAADRARGSSTSATRR